jgi:hypothetical protein
MASICRGAPIGLDAADQTVDDDARLDVAGQVGERYVS